MTKKRKFLDQMRQNETLDEFKEKAELIIETLKEFAKNLKYKIAILTHNDPDPDAVSSCLALKKLLHALGFKKENVVIFAHEESTPPETKVIKEKLGIEIQPLEKFNRKNFKKVILVDAASLNQSNIKLKNGNQPDLIIDHHGDESPFGATATIMTLLMKISDVEIDEDLATALTAGIETDTNDLSSKKVSKFDILAYRKILSTMVNDQLLNDIKKCGYSDSYFEMLRIAMSDTYYRQFGTTVISGVGYIKPNQKTDLAKVTDFLLKKRGVEKVIVIAIVEKEIRDEEKNVIKHEKFIVPTARASTPTENIGDLNKKVFGKEAGGDADKASGEITLSEKDVNRIERAKKDDNKKALEGSFIDILNRYKDVILEEQTS